MEAQKITYLLNNVVTQSSKYRTKNWTVVNDGTQNITPIVKLNLRLQCWSQVFVITLMHTLL